VETLTCTLNILRKGEGIRIKFQTAFTKLKIAFKEHMFCLLIHRWKYSEQPFGAAAVMLSGTKHKNCREPFFVVPPRHVGPRGQW